MFTTSVILKMLQSEGIKISRQALNFFKKNILSKNVIIRSDILNF